MAKNIMRLLSSGFFLLLTVILTLLGKYAPTFVFTLYMPLSQWAMKVISGFFSVFPVAMWELLALAAVIWLLYSLIRDFSQMQFLKWFTGLALSLSVGLFAFMALWGLNYFAPPIHEQLDLSGKEYSVRELRQATVYYRDMANKTAAAVARDKNGAMIPTSFQKQARKAADGYKILEIRTEDFTGSKAAPKRLLSGSLFTFGGASGIFVPYTGECCVSGETHCTVLPFAMCRELGSRMGFARTADAELAAFLACSTHESPEFVYSGYFVAFSYCYNALYAIDQQAAKEVWKGVGQKLGADCDARLAYEQGHHNPSANALREDLGKSYRQLIHEKFGAKTSETVSNLLTMWYYERIK